METDDCIGKHGRYCNGESRQFLVFVTFCIERIFVVHMSGIPPFFIIILCSVSFFLSRVGFRMVWVPRPPMPYTSCELWMTPFGARIRVADSFRFFDIQEIVGIHSLWQLSPNTVLLTGSCLPLSGLAHVRPDLLSTAGCVANKFFGGFSFTFVVRVFSNFYMYLHNAC